jgi:UDP-N-acetylglucosamine 4,6-dehydratase/5-epimerase
VKNIVITGGSGFLGRKLVVTLLNRYPDAQITSLSRSEGTISHLLMDCPDPRLKLEMCDLRDSERVKEILHDKDTVFHLAAMKRVDLSEEKSQEAVTINVIGTLNLIKAFQGQTFIQMSTDKAVEPVNCYGATKLVAERLVLEQAHKNLPGERFMIVRAGNIMGSTGSVLDIWKHQIAERNEIAVTDLNMVRFYTKVESVADLLIAVMERGLNGKIYLTPHTDPVVLGDLVQQALRLYGNENTKVKIIGLRPGERMSEKMFGENEAQMIVPYEDIIVSSNNH